MRKGRFFKYLLAAIVAIGTSFNAMAQDLGKVTITFQENSGSYCNHLILLGTRHQAPTPVYTPNNLGLEISEYEGVHNDWNGAYIGWECGTIYFKNTFKYQVRAVEWDISRGGLFDMRGQTWFGDPSEVEGQDYTIDNKTDDSNSKVYTSANDRFLDQISLNTQSWSGGAMDLFHLKLRKLVIYYYKPEVIVSLSNIKDSEGNAYTLQNGKDMSVGSTGTLSASLGTKHLGRFVASDVTFKYYSANSNIATIDETTGEISAKSSGSVVLTAKMYDNAGNEISDASYVLFVFDKNEGMVWTRNNVSVYNNTKGADSWNMSNTLSSGGNEWNASSTLKGGSLIWDIESGVSGVYREFASFSVPGNALYRTIAQNISCTVSLPKYSSMDYKPIIAGSLMTEDVVEYGVRYGLEVVDLGKQNNSTSITWKTNSTANNTTSVGRYRTGSTPYTILRGGAENNKEENKLFGFINIIKDANDNYLPLVGDSYQVGSDNNNSAIWKGDNKNGASIQEVTYNLAVMSYLWGSTIKNYPASSLFGYSGVPEYTYYAHVSFYDNYKDDEAADFIDRVTLASRGRNVAAKLSHSTFVPNREGYTFKGWSSVKGATTIEYQDQGDFYCFDPENGGGKGEIKLYAVWQPNTYTVTLNRAGGSGGTTSVTATFDEPLPSGDDVKAPTKYGYTFGGYFTGQNGAGTMYYDNSMTGIKNWDIAANRTLYAKWTANVCKVKLLPNGTGAVAGTPYVMVTHGQKFPEEVDGHAVTPPTRPGYIFNGFYQMYMNNKTYFYDKDMKTASCANWPYQADYEVLADWIPTYTVTLDHNDGSGMKEQVAAVYGEAMPAITVPERRGYTFVGYYNGPEDWSQTKYYNADATSARSWDKTSPATIYAHWNMKPYTIIFHSNDSENKTASQEISNQYVGIYTSFSRDGYMLSGWSYTPTGDVVFHNDQIVPSDDINISEPDRVLHLYAQWDLKNMSVTFNYTDPSTKTTISSKNLDGYKLGSSNNSSLSGTIIETPNSDDYVFAGWFDKNENGSMVYDADGNAVEGSSELPGSYYWKKEGNEFVWNSTNDVNLYANWIRDMVSVDVKVIRDDNYENTDYNHRYVGVSVSGLTDIINLSGTNFSGYITVDGVNFLTSDNPNETDNLKSVSLDKAPIWNFRLRNQDIDKSIDEYKDLYTEEPLYDIYTVVNGTTYYLGPKTKEVDGKKDVVESALAVYTSKPDFPFIIYGAGYVCYRPLESKIFNHVLSMIDNNTDWEFENTGRNPQYRPIRIITAGSSISSVSNLNAVKVIKEIKKKLTLPEYAYNVGKANVQETDDDLCNGLLYVDMGNAAKVIEAEKFADFKKETSKNCLLFMPSSYEHIASIGNNVVRKEGTGYKSVDNLVVTDKVPFSSPYTFNTGSYKASYSRETSDKWGSMCLPFPVKRSSDMKYYNLYGSDDLRLAFKSDDGTNDIPANEPIACYGSGSFTLTSNSNAVVPADNASREYDKEVIAISCDNIREFVEDKKQMTTDSKPWNFKGVRFDSYVYGTEYTGTLPNRAKKSLVYYFSKDKFTYVNSKGRVKFAPFRAYLQAPEGSSAKTFSLLVFDEDGATDITEIIDGNAGVANGKIYDLLGRRVKTPLKGHIYIVDGKKKQY